MFIDFNDIDSMTFPGMNNGTGMMTAHIPTTNRIGDVKNKNLTCLLSYHDDPKRKLKYDIEAVLLSDEEN